MQQDHAVAEADRTRFAIAAASAARAIPPAWPLAASIAVNPFLGQAQETLAEAGARLARVAGARVVMPRRWYHARIASGAIGDADLLAALAHAHDRAAPHDLAALKAAAQAEEPAIMPLPTVADLARDCSGIDWPGLIAERLGAWAGGYFDEGQALWAAPRHGGAYRAWRAAAVHDLTPEIVGLAGFAAFIAAAPEGADAAMARAARRLGFGPEETEDYFHRLLMSLGGWGQYARYRLWQAELAGDADATLTEMLAIRLIWEEALWDRYGGRIASAWAAARAEWSRPPRVGEGFVIDAILQDAAERAAQRALAETLAAPARAAAPGRPALLAAFCIDVRSEVLRRALESVDASIRTLGFAGFFGLPIAHRRFASDVAEARLPALLRPRLATRAGASGDAGAETTARLRARAARAWGRFKFAAVSCFAFVESAGPLYVPKLLADTLGLHRARAPAEAAPRFDPAIDGATRLELAAAVLRAMSLTEDFARLVLLVGHGARVVNNPHAAALQCGACGGYPGEVNARLLALLLNDAEVRGGLARQGIVIPEDTLFLGALHDTTTDRVTIHAADHPSATHRKDVAHARAWLDAAGRLARAERSRHLPRAESGRDLPRRGRDWAEVRPEWGLAGCHAFIAAPRRRTAGRSLSGRAFLHDYDWRKDAGFTVLELILTAPVVVASWISLQYYGSVVAPLVFGAGNKLLHNVVGGIGVIEGNGGPLRVGLPWQSVHDGTRHVHEPLRLSVCIEAPTEAILGILDRHESVRTLFDHGWLHLFALDDTGRMAWRYAGQRQWTSARAPVATAAAA